MAIDPAAFHNHRDVRRRLAQACRDAKRRTHTFREEIPTEWQPSSITNPETICREMPDGIPFGEEAAWHFVADLLENGWPLTEKVLDEPPGELAYELVVELSGRELYIKLMPWRGRHVYGRSFHWSTIQRRPTR